MQGKRILVVGYGKLGQRVANHLSLNHPVVALKRSPVEPVANITMCLADVTKIESLNEAFPKCLHDGVDYLIYCLSPSERSEQGYRDAYLTGLKNVLASLPEPETLQHIIFISSTSVYHQEQGEEVDELSPCLPSSFSGKVLLEAETYLAGLAVETTTIRFSGIYGGSRSRLIDQVKHALEMGETLIAAPGYTNRIHEDDCLGFICHLQGLLDQGQKVEACYVGTDSCPVEQVHVYAYLAQQLQPVPNDKGLQINVSKDGKSLRRAGSKRCQNERMLNSGYTLKYASYKEGYDLKIKR